MNHINKKLLCISKIKVVLSIRWKSSVCLHEFDSVSLGGYTLTYMAADLRKLSNSSLTIPHTYSIEISKRQNIRKTYNYY